MAGFLFAYWPHRLGPGILVGAMLFVLLVLVFFVFVAPSLWYD